MNCAQCRFWNRNGDDHAKAQDPPDGRIRKRCLRILHAGYHDAPSLDIAVLTDGSGYAAALWTAAEFACIAFAPVDEPLKATE